MRKRFLTLLLVSVMALSLCACGSPDSSNDDSKAETTRRFFSAVQNKIHYAIHGNTAAEVIYNRADAAQEHMGLTTWEGAPNDKIHKYDVVIAKN